MINRLGIVNIFAMADVKYVLNILKNSRVTLYVFVRLKPNNFVLKVDVMYTHSHTSQRIGKFIVSTFQFIIFLIQCLHY